MEIGIVLLLIVTLTVATPLRPTPRPDAVLPAGTVQGSGLKTETQAQHAQALRIVPFISEIKNLNLEILKHRMAARLRPRRAPQRGCQVGTCQVHNLANKLYQIGQRQGKDESTKVNDPQGYGR
ncbi:adrenomedullin-5 precursor [Takifugu rubripes]|uniref:Adrenomedullin-5 n=1 Tax=Takifugu rubripes TaxID=31033 RepID=Q75XW4_TAKRU|nr:adrenomedullin-5 precursor [Takifugu rubripes]BAD02345.1 adrenomedullin-5 [Takifugu rubripes]|eukprot:NP_001027913.1 adrenomedullin-5 precursor [Takifugu rubripes]